MKYVNGRESVLEDLVPEQRPLKTRSLQQAGAVQSEDGVFVS